MRAAPKRIEAVQVSRIFLLLSNPRHEPFDSEAKAIAYLCNKENVYQLARDIAVLGLNPLESFALIPAEKRKAGQLPYNFYVAEGNRRVCAIKLLNDPDLAPANLRKPFEKLAEQWKPIRTVAGVLFDSIESVKVWLDRIHAGEQGGIGRRAWDADQKARADGTSKNKPALALLDYAEAKGFISSEERVGKLTTVQRFLSTDVFREVLGLDQSNQDDIGRNRPQAEFDLLVKRFMRDVVKKEEVHSRMNKPEIIRYARPLNGLGGVSNTRIETESLTKRGSVRLKKLVSRTPPKLPEKTKYVQHDQRIASALKVLGNGKLESLYHSICSVELNPHTPLVAVGTWSFFETLTACAGRGDADFVSFFSKSRLATYGFTADTVSYRTALARIKEYGNTTKHHPVSATFNGDQLNNDITALAEVVLRCVEDAAKKP